MNNNRRKQLLVAVPLLALLATAVVWQLLSRGDESAILLLQPDENGTLQLHTFTLSDPQPRSLTSAAADLRGFAVDRAREQIAYIVTNEGGDSEIWLRGWPRGESRLVHSCAAAACSRLVWHPDSRRLIFEQRPHETPNRPQLFWLDTENGRTTTVLADETAVSEAAALSPDGQWLSYASLQAEQMIFYHLEEETTAAVPMQLPAPAIWHPEENRFLFSELDLVVYHGDDSTDHQSHGHDFDQSVRIFYADPDSFSPEPLSNHGNVDDANAAWSPDGTWIAFGRRAARTNQGRQLWLIRPDGSEARQLTHEFHIHNGPPRWSADGRYLLFQRYDTSRPQTPPSIWLLEIATGEMRRLQEVGYLPVWIPGS